MSEVMEEEASGLASNGKSTHTPSSSRRSITSPTLTSANDAQYNFPNSQLSVRARYFSTATGSPADKFNLTCAGRTTGDHFGPGGHLQLAKSKSKPSNATPVPGWSPSKHLNSHSSSSKTEIPSVPEPIQT